MKLETGYQSLVSAHLAAHYDERVKQFTAAHPERAVLRLSLADVTRPLPPIVTSAMQMEVANLGAPVTFRGYGDAMGQPALRRAVQDYYTSLGVMVDPDDIFITHGAKDDLALLSRLFSAENTVLLPTPAHPMYEAQSLLAGRAVRFVVGNPENGFLPAPPADTHADLIYLCTPNNPTGVAYTREGLAAWVDYANAHDAVLIVDSAYQAFATSADVPRTIYEIPGAQTCAVEVCSFSKTAGFTGLRCGYTVIPSAIVREGQCLRDLRARAVSAQTAGPSTLTEAAAVAALSPDGLLQITENNRYYLRNAARIASLLTTLSIPFFGGRDTPFVWVPCPDGMDAGAFFDVLLERANVVGTPGEVFGRAGAGYLRFSGFNSREITARAVERLRPVFTELYAK